MDKSNVYQNILELQRNLNATFVGLFIDTYPVTIVTSLQEDKKKIIKDKISHILEKSKEIDEIIPEFGEKYLYAEGEEFALFIYFVKENTAIGTVITSNPKFALILLEHEILAKKLKNIDLSEDDSQEDQYSLENKVKEEFIDSSVFEEINNVYDKKETCEIIKEEEADISDEVPSLEDLIKESIEEHEKISKTDKTVEEKIKKEREIKEEYLDPIVLENIEKEFVKEIGPIAKLILNRKLSELNIDIHHLTTDDIVKLINELAKEIRIEEKKEKFINETNDLL